MSSPSTTLLNNRYRLLTPLAAGGMATVYKGQDAMLGRLVAIKILRDRYAGDPQFVQRFREEAQAAANLNHPNIVTLYDVGRDVLHGVERHYIVMELVDGQDLKQAIRWRTANGQPLSIDETVDIGRQICEGVACAHRRGLVHCDLKPQNILLAADGRVKVTDFGIARAYTAMPPSVERAGVVWGTPQYYSPEQAAGAAPTPASDVYSIGVMLYELLTGRLPFEARDPAQLAQLHPTAAPPPLHAFNPNVTPQLEDIVLRALAKDPTRRYRDADHFARALAAYALQGEAQTMLNLKPATPAPAAAGVPPRPVTSLQSAAPPASSTSLRPSATPPIPSTPASAPPPVAKGATAARGPDVVLWLLAVIAFLCVLGLIPLYVMVYQAYQAPMTIIPPTPLPVGNSTPFPGTDPNGIVQVKVPQLVGRSLDEAVRELSGLGLNIRVIEERPSPTFTQTVVLEQRTSADELVTRGVVVEVVVNKGAELRDVPGNLIGRVLDDSIRRMLTDLGWNVVITEALDFMPPGTILGTFPPAGSKLAVSETLTVTVSSGGRIVLNVNMAPIVLESVTLPHETFVPGQTLRFQVRWRAIQPVGRDYNVGWYLLTPDNSAVLAQGEDRAPQNDGLPAPTSAWSSGTVVNDTYMLRIPDNLGPGAYPLQIGLYSGSERLPVLDPGTTRAVNNLVVLHLIKVR